jgi:hypothetical protein
MKPLWLSDGPTGSGMISETCTQVRLKRCRACSNRCLDLPPFFGEYAVCSFKFCLLDECGRYRFISGFLWLISTSSTVAGPLFIQQIIVAAAAPPRPSGPPDAVAKYNQAIMSKTGGTPLFLDSTYAIAGIMFGLKVTYTLCGRACDQIVRRLGLNIKTVLISAVYKKALKLSAKGSQKYSRGYILNLVNVDCESVSNDNDEAFRAGVDIFAPIDLKGG